MANLAMFSMRSDNPRLSGQLAEHLSTERLTHFVMGLEGDEVRFAVKREKYRDVIDIVERLLFLRGMKAEKRAGGWGLVSLVGERLRDKQEEWKDLAGEALRKAGIGTFGTLQGDLSISFLVNEDDRSNAVKLLHSQFVV
jgi:aspartokinase